MIVHFSIFQGFTIMFPGCSAPAAFQRWRPRATSRLASSARSFGAEAARRRARRYWKPSGLVKGVVFVSLTLLLNNLVQWKEWIFHLEMVIFHRYGELP